MKQQCFNQLVKFSLKPKNNPYFYEAMESFFYEIAENMGLEDYNYIADVVGPQIYSTLEMQALDYFFSNNYDGEIEGTYWNVIDQFLQRKANALDEEDLKYLKGLRHSTMGVYEVTKETNDRIVALKDMADNKNTYQVDVSTINPTPKKGDILGARIIDMSDHLRLSKASLHLSKSIAKTAVDTIKFNKRMTAFAPAFMPSSIKIDSDYIQHISESMAAKEIAEAWLDGLIDQATTKKMSQGSAVRIA